MAPPAVEVNVVADPETHDMLADVVLRQMLYVNDAA